MKTHYYTHDTKHAILNHNIGTQHWKTRLTHNTIHAILNTQYYTHNTETHH